MTTDLKNNIIEKLEAAKKEMELFKFKLTDVMDSVKDSVQNCRKQILEDPKYFFIPALIASGLFLLLISFFLVIDRTPFENLTKEAATDLEKKLDDLSKDTQEALKLMLRKFKEEMLDEFGEQYGCGCHKFKEVVITFLIGLICMGSFYRIFKGSFEEMK